MWCTNKFAEFNVNLTLDQTRHDRIESAFNRLVGYCSSHRELKAAMTADPFFQGSFSYGTIIRPRSENEFDIDVIYPFTLTAFSGQTPSGTQLLNWFVQQLAEDSDYKKRLIKMPRCARLDYAGDFHLDIVMSTKDLGHHQPYAVPTRDLTGWVTNDPIGIKRWVEDNNGRSRRADTNGVERFARCVRMMKRWRDELIPGTAAPSSILLLTMLGKHEPSVRTYNPPLSDPLFPQYSTDAAYIYDMSRLTLSCIRTSDRQSFIHPTISGDDLAANWKAEDIVKFEQHLEKFIKNMESAINAGTENDSVYYYKRAFGDTFPA